MRYPAGRVSADIFKRKQDFSQFLISTKDHRHRKSNREIFRLHPVAFEPAFELLQILKICLE